MSKRIDIQQGLKVEVSKSGLRITIGLRTLKKAAESHEQFWQPLTDKYALVVSEPLVFAEEVCSALSREEEDGSTPIHRLLDAAIEQAINDGCEGVDHEAMDEIVEAERIALSE